MLRSLKRVLPAMAIAAALGACGVDGEPVTPTANVNLGVSSGGAYGGASVGVGQGPWHLTLGHWF